MSKSVILLVAGVLVAPIVVAVAQEAARSHNVPAPSTQPTSAQAATQPQGGEAQKREEQLLAMLKQRDQANYEAVLKLKETDPAEYRRYIRRATSWLDRVNDLPPQVAESYMVIQETKVKLWRLAELLQTARSGKAKSRVAAQIRQSVERQFDAEQVVMQYRLEHLRQDIDRLQKKLKERAEQREQLINERVEQILNPTTQPATQETPDKDLKLR